MRRARSVYRVLRQVACGVGVGSGGVSSGAGSRTLCRGRLHPYGVPHATRWYASKPPGDGDDDEYDEFGMDAFGDADFEEEEQVPVVDKPIDDEEMTPEMADELVERMVAAATASRTAVPSGASEVPHLTPHVISILRAARITTNEVIGAGVEPLDYPISRKVVAELDLANESLALSPEARAALVVLAGTRYNSDTSIVKVVGHKYSTSEENQAYVVARMEQLVREARRCVGEQVDNNPIASWDQVVQEVVRQTGKDKQFVYDITTPRDAEEESFDSDTFAAKHLQ